MPAARRALVFDLDHTLVSSPLDLRALATDMLVFLRGEGVTLPPRDFRWSAPELVRLVREQAPSLEDGLWEIALAHEQRALGEARLEPGALERSGPCALWGSGRRSGPTTAGRRPARCWSTSPWPLTWISS